MPSAIFLPLFLLSLIPGCVTAVYLWTNARLSLKGPRPRARAPTPTASDVTILVPVHRQDLGLFGRVLEAASGQAAQVLVVGDGCKEPYASLARKRGANFLATPVHGGKRAALAHGLAAVATPFVLFLDSDTLLPPGGVARLRAQMTRGVGGVSANLSVAQDGGALSHLSEFIERSREVVLRAMSARGNVMLLDGACSLYRVRAIRDFVGSPDFQELRVLGRPSALGDDWLLTSHLLRAGWGTSKAYDVKVETRAPAQLEGFLHRHTRWARSGWIRLGNDLRRGTLAKGGRFYRWEVLGTYLLPLMTFTALLARLPLAFERGPVGFLPPILTALLFGSGRPWSSAHATFLLISSVPLVAETAAAAFFLWAALRRTTGSKLRSALLSPFASLVMYLTSIYGLLTFWKATEWDRPVPEGPHPEARPPLP